MSMNCICNNDEFEKRGCWYARQIPERSEYQCTQPCVQSLVEENKKLKDRVEDLSKKLKSLKSEV